MALGMRHLKLISDGYHRQSNEDWERDELISNLVTQLKKCSPEIQERMVEHLTQCDLEYGTRVREGLKQGGDM